ncbi:MAG: hypothetical protein A4S09_09615 [Proteobacteria bacterium SG_bin7]|nr:MAG: hypothetical protein A4S09_09615 [Proteobacteria bacterium SG_bin7]
MKKTLVLFFVFSFAVGCVSSPLGRKQLIIVSDEQMDQMGSMGFDEMKTKIPKARDQRLVNYVNCVVNPLTKVVGGNWEVVVFQEKSANAFALPGGKIGVHTGILEAAKTDAQLAAVVGHEVGHVLAKHGAERVSQTLAAQGGLEILDKILTGKSNGNKREAIMAGIGLGIQYGILLPWGRTQESEADVIGLDLMSQAGFDPHQSVELWKNMASLGGGQPPEWLSTHPSNETRINNLQAKIPEYLPKYQQAVNRGLHPRCAF